MLAPLVLTALLGPPHIEEQLHHRPPPWLPEPELLDEGAAAAPREATLGAGVNLSDGLRLHGRIRRTVRRVEHGSEEVALAATRALVFLTGEPGVGPILLHAGISWEAQRTTTRSALRSWSRAVAVVGAGLGTAGFAAGSPGAALTASAYPWGRQSYDGDDLWGGRATLKLRWAKASPLNRGSAVWLELDAWAERIELDGERNGLHGDQDDLGALVTFGCALL